MWLNKTLVKTLMTVVGGRHTLPVMSSPMQVQSVLKNGHRMTATYKSYENSKYMQKLLNKKGSKTKKTWYKSHLGESMEVERNQPKKKGISHGHSVRLRQLSRVIYVKATEIINTGELSQEILEKHVSITAVKIARDMNSINIYWEADRRDWQEVETLLMSHSWKLRSLLISYHVLGRIPHIVFVKDKSTVNLQQMQELFDAADYGPDYVPGVTNEDPGEADDHEKDEYVDKIISDRLGNVALQSNRDKSELSLNESKKSLDDGEDEVDGNSLTSYYHSFKSVSDNSRSQDLNLGLEDKWRDEICTQRSHTDSEQFVPKDRYLNSDCGDNRNSVETNAAKSASNFQETSKLNAQNFRSDVYGLDRDEMVKKILAAKKSSSRRHSSPNNVTPCSLPQQAVDINPKDVPDIVSPTLSKIALQKKLAKIERRNRERMLERD